VDERNIARVDEQAERLAGDEYRVLAVKRVDQQQRAAAGREQPERQWNHAAPRALGGDPLHQEARREQRLRQKTERNPPIELQDEDFAQIAPKRVPDVSKCASPPTTDARGRGLDTATSGR